MWCFSMCNGCNFQLCIDVVCMVMGCDYDQNSKALLLHMTLGIINQ